MPVVSTLIAAWQSPPLRRARAVFSVTTEIPIVMTSYSRQKKRELTAALRDS